MSNVCDNLCISSNTKQERSYGTNLFIIKFPAETWKTIKVDIRETLQNYFAAKLLNQIDNVVIIQNKVWYQLKYRLFDMWN